jgi:hypothetical protein
LDREIERLEALPDSRTDYDTALLIGVLKMAKHARTLDGFCVFTNTREEPFKASDRIPAKMVADISDAIHALHQRASFQLSRPITTRDFPVEMSM